MLIDNDTGDMVVILSRKIKEEIGDFSRQPDYEALHDICYTFMLLGEDYPLCEYQIEDITEIHPKLDETKLKNALYKTLQEMKISDDTIKQYLNSSSVPEES